MSWSFIDSAGRRGMRAFGARSRTVGGLHGYAATGRGTLPPLVLLHGIGASGMVWGQVLRLLLRDAGSLFIPDLPAHGFSAAPERLDVQGILDALEPALCTELTAPAILVGHSLGALMAIRFALRHPELVRGLLLVTPAGATFAPGALQKVQAALDLRTNADARGMLEKMYVRPPWYLPLLAPYIRESYGRPALRRVLASVNVGELLSAQELGALQGPVELLWGKQDRLLPPSDLAYFRAHLPAQATILELDGFGHAPVLDAAPLLARRIVEFARSAADPPSPGAASGADR